jgi:hypothetical protein
MMQTQHQDLYDSDLNNANTVLSAISCASVQYVIIPHLSWLDWHLT